MQSPSTVDVVIHTYFYLKGGRQRSAYAAKTKAIKIINRDGILYQSLFKFFISVIFPAYHFEKLMFCNKNTLSFIIIILHFLDNLFNKKASV